MSKGSSSSIFFFFFFLFYTSKEDSDRIVSSSLVYTIVDPEQGSADSSSKSIGKSCECEKEKEGIERVSKCPFEKEENKCGQHS